MTSHNIGLGSYGERIAVGYLKKHGYRIIQTDFRSPIGQIDIIARDGDCIVFAEVKTRSSEEFGLPEEAIDRKKMKKMQAMGWIYLKKKNLCANSCRFDVVSIMIKNGEVSVNLIKDAF